MLMWWLFPSFLQITIYLLFVTGWPAVELWSCIPLSLPHKTYLELHPGEERTSVVPLVPD